jgi:phospholipid-translocating ATPase
VLFTSVIDYTYLLFWNVFWSLAPVIAIGVFDRHIGRQFLTLFALYPVLMKPVDDDVLMAIPELYRYGREGTHFGLWMFSWYMVDAVAQVRYALVCLPWPMTDCSVQAAIVFFLTTFSYSLTSSRSDGYQIAMYEYSATMVLATVLIVNLFNGLNTTAWTGWVFFAVSFGVVLVWVFTVSELC